MPLWSNLVYVLGPEVGLLAGENGGGVKILDNLHCGPTGVL